MSLLVMRGRPLMNRTDRVLLAVIVALMAVQWWRP